MFAGAKQTNLKIARVMCVKQKGYFPLYYNNDYDKCLDKERLFMGNGLLKNDLHLYPLHISSMHERADGSRVACMSGDGTKVGVESMNIK